MLETAHKTVSGFRIARIRTSGSARRRNDALGAAYRRRVRPCPSPPLGVVAPHRIPRLAAVACLARYASSLAGVTFTPAQPPSVINSPCEKTNLGHRSNRTADRAVPVEGTGVEGRRGFNRAVYVWLRRGRGASLEYRIIIAPLAASPRIATIASICSAPWSRARLTVADATPHRPPRPMSPGMRPVERLPRGYRSAQGPAGTGTIEE